MACLLRLMHVTYVMHHIISLINKMLSKEDRVLIKVLRVEDGYGAKRIMTEFPARDWVLASMKDLLHEIDTTGSAGTASQAVTNVTLHTLAQTLNFLNSLRCILQKHHTIV